MARERYMAMCNPLVYTIVMNKKVCIQMVLSTYLYSLSVGLLQAILTFHLSSCRSNIINHFCCDVVPLVFLACPETHYKYMKKLLLFTPAGFNIFFSFFIILVSYIFILFAILRIKSAEGRKKAFLLVLPTWFPSLYFMVRSSSHICSQKQAILWILIKYLLYSI